MVSFPRALIWAAVFCVIFGICMIVNTNLPLDGGWYWYAKLVSQGALLYSDLKFNLQPFFVLQTLASLSIFGEGWLVSKILPALQLCLFVLGLAAFISRSEWATPAFKAVLLAAAFFVAIGFEYYRFDDYHIVVHNCYIFSCLILLHLHQDHPRRYLPLLVLLGGIAGIASADRINDGLMLFAISGFVLLCFDPSSRMYRTRAVDALLYAVSAVSMFALIIAMTGDSLRAYVNYSIFDAISAKGGTGDVVGRPVAMLVYAANFLSTREAIALLSISVLFVASCAYFPTWHFTPGQTRTGRVIRLLISAAGVSLSAYCWVLSTNLYVRLNTTLFVYVWTCIGVFVLHFGALLVLVVRVAGVVRDSPPRLKSLRHSATSAGYPILFAFGLLVSQSTSSGGGSPLGLTMPMGMLVASVSLVNGVKGSHKRLLRIFCVLLASVGALVKISNPASWNGVGSHPMFSERLLIHHPIYGPMIVEQSLYRFSETICTLIAERSGKQNRELLSIPFSYANYYCGIAPWKAFVQTFFDTSTKSAIDSMIQLLKNSPPEWILYQRQLWNLRRHEMVYNNGRRLPHRDLDEYLAGKVQSQDWSIAWQGPYGFQTEWFLIHTRPSAERVRERQGQSQLPGGAGGVDRRSTRMRSR
jgi:hypothetical protein